MSDLIAVLDDIVAEQSAAVIPWVIADLLYYRGVFLIAGAPKVGKSTLVADLIRARVHGGWWAGMDVAQGPTLLLTEEGPMPTAWRWHRSVAGTPPVEVIFRHIALEQWARDQEHRQALEQFATAEARREHESEGSFPAWARTKVKTWLEGQRNALVIVDTLAVWGDVEDENSASETTKAISAWTRIAQDTGACILLVHHTRKSGGSFGEGIRGSSAILGTADGSWEVTRSGESSTDTRRKIAVLSRMAFGRDMTLAYDPETGAYSPAEETQLADIEELLSVCPASGEGRKIGDLASLWEVSRSTAKRRVEMLLNVGRLRREEVATGSGGSPAWRYWSIPASGSVSAAAYLRPTRA